MQESHVSVTASVVDWLLESDEPGIVAQAKRDLFDEQAPAEAARVLEGPKVHILLAGQQADGRSTRSACSVNAAGRSSA
jgi:hypothetical protein